MRYKIVHETEYQFTSEVFLEPHYLRLRPKATPNQKLDSFDLKISPEPRGIREHTDAENNIVHLCWFEGMTSRLIVLSESIVTIADHNPLQFIIHPIEYSSVPFVYSNPLKDTLSEALKFRELSFALIEYGERIKNESKNSTVQFLINLTTQIHKDFTVESRIEGLPFEADLTFRLKKASCRDLSWMQIQILRHLGIASRFVSGYFYIGLEKPVYELHAWVEVFLPGAGWIGFDPSNGIVCGNKHIPIASSSIAENTLPVAGNFRGSAASVLTTNLMIEEI
jgi:transglutaminase-like putative cysteine protease